MRFSLSTFLRNTQPRSRGALFLRPPPSTFPTASPPGVADGASNLHARPAHSFQSAHAAISPQGNGAHKALSVPPLNSAAAHNDVILHPEEGLGRRAKR